MKEPIYIASCSFGKDSIATILLAIENNEPLDRVVFSEVMYDHSRNISGETPEHIEWIYNVAKPKLEAMGVRVDIVRTQRDYLSYFHKLRTKGRFAGKKYGFPIAGMCIINSACKVKALKDYYKQFKDYEIRSYVGIAIDEPVRLERALGKGQISLLAKYGYTEEMAKQKCVEYGLLSPTYKTGSRGGCWFCPNRTIRDWVAFKTEYPALFNELLELGKDPNISTDIFTYGGLIIGDINERIESYNKQLNINW